MKLTIHMAMGSNEQAVLEIPLKDLQDWQGKVAPALKAMEERVGQRARRILSANTQLKALQAKDPVAASLVHNLVLLALGEFPQVGTIGLVDLMENTAPGVLIPRAEEAAQ